MGRNPRPGAPKPTMMDAAPGVLSSFKKKVDEAGSYTPTVRDPLPSQSPTRPTWSPPAPKPTIVSAAPGVFVSRRKKVPDAGSYPPTPSKPRFGALGNSNDHSPDPM